MQQKTVRLATATWHFPCPEPVMLYRFKSERNTHNNKQLLLVGIEDYLSRKRQGEFIGDCNRSDCFKADVAKIEIPGNCMPAIACTCKKTEVCEVITSLKINVVQDSLGLWELTDLSKTRVGRPGDQ